MNSKKHNYQKYATPLDRKAKVAEQLHRRTLRENALLNINVNSDEYDDHDYVDDGYELDDEILD